MADVSFWYTVLALSEMDNVEARAELKYATPELTRVANRSVSSTVYAGRRYQLAERSHVCNDALPSVTSKIVSKRSRNMIRRSCASASPYALHL